MGKKVQSNKEQNRDPSEIIENAFENKLQTTNSHLWEF